MAKAGDTGPLQAGCARDWAGARASRLLLRIVAAAAILCSAAAADLNGMLGMEFEGIAEKQAEYMQTHGFKNETCSDVLEDPFALDATQFLDRFTEIIGTDTIRAMSIRNMRTVGVIKQQSQATRLATHTPRSSRGMPKPKVEAGTGKLATCAIIGSSGHLRATSYGPNIDKFDLVARGNQAPTKGYEEFVGSKTTMRFLNDALTKRYRQSVNGAIMAAIKSCVLKKRSWKRTVSLMSARGKKTADAKKPLSRPQPVKLALKPTSKAGGRRALLEDEDGGRAQGTFRGMNLSARLSAGSSRIGAEELSKRLTLAFRERKGPLSAPWSALKGYVASLTNTENRSKARKTEVMQLASTCERSLMDEVAKAGKITQDSVRYDSWMFPLEQGVILTHISEFKLSNLPEDHSRLVGHLRLHRPDVKSAMVNYPVSFLAEDIIKKWADRLVCKGVLPEAGGTRPTTGFTMLLSLLPVCGKVVMYGFGPPSGNPPNGTDYHFFQGMLNRNWQTTSADVHNFKAEYLFIKSLARKGRLTICNNANSDECGLNDENLDAAEAAEEALGGAVKAVEARRGTVSPSVKNTAKGQGVEQEGKHEAEGLSKAASMTFVDPNQVFETLPEEADHVPEDADNEDDMDVLFVDAQPKSPNDAPLGMTGVEDL